MRLPVSIRRRLLLLVVPGILTALVLFSFVSQHFSGSDVSDYLTPYNVDQPEAVHARVETPQAIVAPPLPPPPIPLQTSTTTLTSSPDPTAAFSPPPVPAKPKPKTTSTGFLPFQFTSDLALLPQPSQAPTPNPKISVIVIWEDKGSAQPPAYQHFLASVRANADSIELVWVGIRQDDDACRDPMAGLEFETGEGNNVKFVCLDRTQYWTLHRDYFCAPNHWACSPSEAESVLQTMIERHDLDWYASFFRLWRGYVFRRYIDPGVSWWAWADQDVFFGNFRSQFPWDASEFDVLIPGGGTLIYMRGHLCFFRAGMSTESKLLTYPPLSSPQAYISQHVRNDVSPSMEEAEFSAFIVRNEDISFLMFDNALLEIPSYSLSASTPKFATLHGIYAPSDLPDADAPQHHTPLFPAHPHIPVLALPGTCSAHPHCPPPSYFSPTWSWQGHTAQISLVTAEEAHEELWFPKRFATSYDYPEHGEVEFEVRRFVGRGGQWMGGPEGVWERVEPVREPLEVVSVDGRARVRLEEGLYIHWFEEKHNAPWFHALPARPLGVNETLVSAHIYGAELWDNERGAVTWRGAAAEPDFGREKEDL